LKKGRGERKEKKTFSCEMAIVNVGLPSKTVAGSRGRKEKEQRGDKGNFF